MDSPRGRIYLMKAGVEGRAEMTAQFVQHFDRCLGCLACVTACPSGVQYAPLIEKQRAQIEREYTRGDRKSTRLNSSHGYISYAVFCLKKKTISPAAQREDISAQPDGRQRDVRS